MKRRDPAGAPTRFTSFLVRASVVPLLLFATLAGYLVGETVLDANAATRSLLQVPQPEHPSWKASYSREFPHCVALVLWPDRERPVAFVVRRGSEVERMGARAAYEALSPGPASKADDVRIIGACRRG